MTEENWVKLPEPAPKTLPELTMLKLCSWCEDPLYWVVTSELVAEDDLRLVRYRGRAASGGKPEQEFVVASDNISRVKLPSGYHFSGSEVVKEEAKPEPTYATFAQAWASRQNQAEQQRGSGIWQVAQIQVNQQQFEAGALQAQQRALEKLAANPNAISNQFSPGYPQTKKPACSCGATENVRDVTPEIRVKLAKLRGQETTLEFRCGPCEQTRRRAERAAQKLDQARRDLDRPVKRDPYEWLGFSSPTWEE